ncbi:MAG: ribbon-helix-helix domain-containing protein [Planctomycetota bacterium]|jgi:metal-responsive CopG/Arc/MetJ family transcriptional regulator
MKSKTSITLSGAILNGIDEHSTDFRSRSEFIETAVRHFIAHLERQESQRRDLEIINCRAEVLNREAEDVLGYQVPL